MSFTVLRLMFDGWRPLLGRLARSLAPAAIEPWDCPFAPNDIAQLHRLTPHDGADTLDDPAWRDLHQRHRAAGRARLRLSGAGQGGRVAGWLASQRGGGAGADLLDDPLRGS